jgi:RNA polymerase sigma factor (sigma-70 family)
MDESSFEAVYDAEAAGLTRLAYLIVGSVPVAEDLVQEAFEALHQRWDTIENPGGFARTVLVRRCLRHRQRARMEAERVARLAPVGADDPEVDHLWDVLARLRPDRRAALVLRYYEDLPYEEIAALLGIKEATARTRVHRGLADLERELRR